MPRRRNPLKQHTLYFLAWFFFSLCQTLPLSWARRLGTGLAALGYYLVPRIRKVGRANLDIVYGNELSEQEKTRILRASVKNLGLVAIEFTQLPRLLQGEFQRLVTIKGRELVDSSRGTIVIGAHHSNWEWMLPVGILLGRKTAAVVRDFDDPRMDRLVKDVRCASGITIISKNNAMAALLREVRGGALVGLLADQNPRENAVPVQFFGRKTWATAGPVMLALRAKAPIHPISMVRQEDGSYVFEFQPEIELTRTGNMVEDLLVNTQRCQDALETIIRNNPEQWLWFHRRWKKRERLEREWAAREAKRGQVPAEGEDAPGQAT